MTDEPRKGMEGPFSSRRNLEVSRALKYAAAIDQDAQKDLVLPRH